jgi:hypothetical protein
MPAWMEVTMDEGMGRKKSLRLSAVLNGNLHEQLSYRPPIFKSRLDWPFKQAPPLLRAA